jgi:hypothetical protein
MKIFSSNKGILAIVAIFVLVMFLYNVFIKGEPIPLESELAATTIAEDLLQTSMELEAIKFDQAAFSAPGYLLLVDFNIEIEPQPLGRLNPFANIGL